MISNNFSSSFTQKLISSEDIDIVYGGGIYHLTGDDIISYHLTGSGKFICDDLPYLETTIEVCNWNLLTTAQKNELIKGKYLYTYYIVEGVKSIGARVSVIKSVKASFDGMRATIVSQNAIRTYKDPFYTNLSKNYASSHLNRIIDIDGKSKTINIENDFLCAENPQVNVSKYETLQGLVASCGGNLKITFDGTQFNVDISILASKSVDYVMPQLNAYDDVDVEENEIYTNVGAIGYEIVGSTKIGQSSNIQPDSQGNLNFIFAVPENEIVANVNVVRVGGGDVGQAIFTQRGQIIFASYENVPSGVYYAEAYGGTINQPTYSTNFEKVILALNCDNTLDYDQLNLLKSNALYYFSLTEDISFSCRINPCIELLDVITIFNRNIAVEELTIDFKGSYKGSIKGKIINAISDIDWLNVNFIFYPLSCEIELENTSNENKTFVLNVDDNSEELTINANSTLILSQIDYVWLNQVFDKMQHLTGYLPFVRAYVSQNNKLIAEHNYTDEIYYPPVICDFGIYQDDDWAFDIRNINKFSVYCTIYGSRNLYGKTFISGEKQSFNAQNYPDISVYFTEKRSGTLEHDLYTYFNESEKGNSGTTIILEEDD